MAGMAFKPPDHFNQEQVRAWEELTDELYRSGTLDPGDRQRIELAAELMGTIREIRQILVSERARLAEWEIPADLDDEERERAEMIKAGRGYYARSVRGVTVNPLYALRRESMKNWHQVVGQLPLSETARKRLQVEAAGRDTGDDDLDVPLRRVK